MRWSLIFAASRTATVDVGSSGFLGQQCPTQRRLLRGRHEHVRMGLPIDRNKCQALEGFDGLLRQHVDVSFQSLAPSHLPEPPSSPFNELPIEFSFIFLLGSHAALQVRHRAIERTPRVTRSSGRCVHLGWLIEKLSN